MTCEQATELLPWLVNGSLGPQQRAEARHHLESCEQCRNALGETRKAWKVFSEHLPASVLVALAYGEAPEGYDPGLAERHVASCPQCAADLELARMSRRLEGEDQILVFPQRGGRETRRESQPWRTAALAASLVGLIAVGGWSFSALQAGRIPELEAQNRQIQEEQTRLQTAVQQAQSQLAQIAAGQEPQINTWTQDLNLEDRYRGGAGESSTPEAGEVVIPAGVQATSILQAGEDSASGVRRIEILDAGGRMVWGKDGLQRNSATDDFTFTLPPGFLKPGRYTIQLYTREGGKLAPQETYKIRVQ
jgi:Putative zinc-finger